MHQNDTNLSKYSLMTFFSPIKLNPELHASPTLLGLVTHRGEIGLYELLSQVLGSFHGTFWQRYAKMFYLPTGPQQTQLLVGPVSVLALSPSSLMPFSELFPHGTARGWQLWQVGALSPLCPSHGVTLSFALCLQEGYFLYNWFGHFNQLILPVFSLLTLELALSSWVGCVGKILVLKKPKPFLTPFPRPRGAVTPRKGLERSNVSQTLGHTWFQLSLHPAGSALCWIQHFSMPPSILKPVVHERGMKMLLGVPELHGDTLLPLAA